MIISDLPWNFKEVFQVDMETLYLYQSLPPEDRRVVDIVIYTLLARRQINQRERELEIGFNALLIALAKARSEGR